MGKEKTATLIQDFLPKFRGRAALYHLSHYIEYTSYNEESFTAEKEFTYYVICSTVEIKLPTIEETTETYIFPATEDGQILEFSELSGSSKNTESHEFVLDKLGFKLIRDKVSFDNAKIILNLPSQ